MFTRAWLASSYSAPEIKRLNKHGQIVEQNVNNVDVAMPVSRPVFGWDGDGAPYYLKPDELTRPAARNTFAHAGTLAVQCLKPRLEMDPSDPLSWQREYRFT